MFRSPGISIVAPVQIKEVLKLLRFTQHLARGLDQTFAGGAILMMLTNTMVPESYQHAGKLAGVFTVLGFTVAVLIVILEHS